MVLSRVVLNPECTRVRRDLADRYEMHSTLMRLVDAGASKPLWRLENSRIAAQPFVLIQTEDHPTLEALQENDDYFVEQGSGSRNNILLRNLQSGDQLNFRVRANPTVTRERKRHGLVRYEDQIDWLHRQMNRGGARVLDVQTSDVLRERMARRRGGKPIVIQGVTFDGVVEVEDAVQFRETVQRGIGHARALGFGLITLAQ